ncbi:MAG: hypothetical protein EBU81_12565, partial [Proteobacteria bacterium]|nr:hypothetical protein [Pseudomonadota bacterium]
ADRLGLIAARGTQRGAPTKYTTCYNAKQRGVRVDSAYDGKMTRVRTRDVARAAADAEFAEVFEDAVVAGRTAAALWVVRPMFVQCDGYVEVVDEGEFGKAGLLVSASSVTPGMLL